MNQQKVEMLASEGGDLGVITELLWGVVKSVVTLQLIHVIRACIT